MISRPIEIADLLLLAGGNVRTVEAPQPETLAALVNAELATWAGSSAEYPYLVGWKVAGGGGGAAWRCTLELARNHAWGCNRAVPAGVCRMRCMVALNAAEITNVANQMLVAIEAEDSDAVVWGTQVTGSARDGLYLVSILYSLGGIGGRATYRLESLGTQGPYVAQTDILTLSLPGRLAGAPTMRVWEIDYAIEVEDTTGASGVVADVEYVGFGLAAEQDWSAPAGEWRGFSGHIYYEQTDAVATVKLRVTPVGANVSCRNARFLAHLIEHQYETG